MKTKIYLSIIILLCFSCKGKTNTNTPLTTEAETPIETFEDLFSDLDDSKSLYDIRFGNWTEEDWLDNEYFRFLRKCFDDYYHKGIENEDTHCLQDYKPLLNNQFYIYKVEPFFMGGLFITLGVLNNPETLYETVVYSIVDEDTETVIGYSLRGFGKSKTTSNFTKEQVLEVIKDNPTHKLW